MKWCLTLFPPSTLPYVPSRPISLQWKNSNHLKWANPHLLTANSRPLVISPKRQWFLNLPNKCQSHKSPNCRLIQKFDHVCNSGQNRNLSHSSKCKSSGRRMMTACSDLHSWFNSMLCSMNHRPVATPCSDEWAPCHCHYVTWGHSLGNKAEDIFHISLQNMDAPKPGTVQ